jgi:hypothetical protein
MNTTYQLSNVATGLVLHGQFRQFFARDIADTPDQYNELKVQVRSGDYFETLATKLDHIRTSSYANEELNAAITDLLYLQKAYRIVEK